MSMCPLRELSRSSLYGRISAVIGGAVFSCAAVLAQQIGVTYSAAAQTDVAPKSLSPASQAVMERLSHLGEIPIDDLRYYAGDIPNGGAVGVDDSVWQKIQLPFSAPSGPIWLRKRIEVPKTLEGYDPTGAKIWLREHRAAAWFRREFHTSREGWDSGPSPLVSVESRRSSRRSNSTVSCSSCMP